ncbi:hypothetical protein Tco_0553062 [Tanacetum coccineum]
MQMMYCFINNIHVYYAKLLWEGLHYSLHHPTSSIPYTRFTKIIISHYMTKFPKISRRARDRYHNLKDDDIMKNICNSGRYKDRVGMKIPAWVISEEMKHAEHYRMYAEVFGIDVPLTQSQPTESTQAMHRTPSSPSSPNPNMDAGVSSALKRLTVIRLCIPQRRSTCLTPPAPVPNVDKADEIILQDTLQVSLAEHKSQEEQEARENVELVNEHLASVEIKKMVEGTENVIDDSSNPRNDDQNIPGTRLEPRSDKESPKVEITNVEEVETNNAVIPMNVNEEEEKITDEVYELKQRDKGKIVEESKSTPFPTPIRSPRIHIDLAWFLSRKSFDTLADHLQEVMVESLPTMVDKHIKEQVETQVPEQLSVRSYMSGHILHVHPAQPQTTYVPEQKYQLVPRLLVDNPAIQPSDQDVLMMMLILRGENHDDEVPTKQVSQDIMEEVSLTINEAKLKKIADEMLRQMIGTSGFPPIIFNDVDIEERTSRWVNKCVKKFNPYTRYGVEHWKNPHAKIFYIDAEREEGLENQRSCLFGIQDIQVIKRTGIWAMNTVHHTDSARRAICVHSVSLRV